MTVKKYSQAGNIQGNYKKTPTTQKAVNTESQQNIHFMAPTQPFGRTAPNKLLTRKRKRSRHPLRDLRLQRGYTLEELADLTKLSPSYLSRLESGTRRLNADILQRLAHVLSCHPGDLLLTDAQSSKFVMMSRMQNENNETSDGTTSSVRFSTPDLPLYKVTNKNSKSVIDFENPQEWVARPYELVGIAGAISFCIDPSNNNLGPRYRSGDHIFAHPTRPLSPQCSILLITQEGEAIVGDFEGWQQESDKADHCIVSTTELSKNNQLMTKKLSFSNDKIQAIYRIVGLMEAV